MPLREAEIDDWGFILMYLWTTRDGVSNVDLPVLISRSTGIVCLQWRTALGAGVHAAQRNNSEIPERTHAPTAYKTVQNVLRRNIAQSYVRRTRARCTD